MTDKGEGAEFAAGLRGPGDSGEGGAAGRFRARSELRVLRARDDGGSRGAEGAVDPGPAAALGPGMDGAEPPPDDAPTVSLPLADLCDQMQGMQPRVSVRPYVRTRGRTHARVALDVETLVSVPSPRPAVDDPEHRTISSLCERPRSVAELAALIGAPLGVARVLIGDMADQGRLTIHPTLAWHTAGSRPDLAVLERVLRGLHRL